MMESFEDVAFYIINSLGGFPKGKLLLLQVICGYIRCNFVSNLCQQNTVYVELFQYHSVMMCFISHFVHLENN